MGMTTNVHVGLAKWGTMKWSFNCGKSFLFHTQKNQIVLRERERENENLYEWY